MANRILKPEEVRDMVREKVKEIADKYGLDDEQHKVLIEYGERIFGMPLKPPDAPQEG